MSLSDRSMPGNSVRKELRTSRHRERDVVPSVQPESAALEKSESVSHAAHLGAVEVGVPRDATLYRRIEQECSVNEMPTSLQSVSFVRCIVPLIICVCWIGRIAPAWRSQSTPRVPASSRKVGSRQTCNRGMSTPDKSRLQRSQRGRNRYPSPLSMPRSASFLNPRIASGGNRLIHVSS